MENYSLHVGGRIKHLRKKQKITSSELAAKINKSKSTLSKYENGQISIDINTLFDISKALNVDISRLTHYNDPKNTQGVSESKLFDGASNLYVYCYDGQEKRIKYSFLWLTTDENNNLTVNYYYDIPSFEKFIECKYFFVGTAVSYDILTYFLLTNNENHVERAILTCYNTLGQSLYTIGMGTGITSTSHSPLAMKILVSKIPIVDEKTLLDKLIFTKEEHKNFKSSNLLIIPNI